MESRGGEELTKLTNKDIHDIMSHGDLTRIHEVCAWVAENESTKVRELFLWPPILVVSDGPSLRTLAEQPEFPLVKQLFFDNFELGSNDTSLDDNPILLEMLCDVLLPLVGPDDETKLRSILITAIQRRKDVAICDCFDALWSKATAHVSDDVEHLKEFYSHIGCCLSNVSLVTLVIRTGISRHMRVLRILINDTVDEIDTYTQSKLLEWAIISNITISDMPVIKWLRDDFA